MLHIHNGDSAAGTAKKSDIPGRHLAWREALVCGPAPGNLSIDEFCQTRAQHLTDAYGADLERTEQELRAQEETLARFSDHEEVVLWFEHDLFCQVQLIYLLHRFAQSEPGKTRLSLICIKEFPGVSGFRGFGELNEEQLATLFPERQEITRPQLELGAKAWQAYSAADAAAWFSLAGPDTSALPFLKRAISKHLQRFPSTENGLCRIESVGLELIAGGYCGFRSLFPAFASREPEYGYGDAQLFLAMRRLAYAPTPALTLNGGNNRAANDPAQMLLSSFEITEFGKRVLAGEEDFVSSNGIDHWLGGVHLVGNEAPWRWDEPAQELLVRL
jgi:hypothetical protein